MVQPVTPHRRVDTDLFSRAQLLERMAQGEAHDRVTYLNTLLRSAWLALWSGSEPHRKQWSAEAVDRTRGLLVRDPGPFAEYPRPLPKRGPSSSPAPSPAAGSNASGAAGSFHGRPGAGGKKVGGRSSMGSESHTTGLMRNTRQRCGLESQDVITPRTQVTRGLQTRAKVVDEGVRSSSDLRTEARQQHQGAERVSRDTTPGSMGTDKMFEHVGTRELGLDQDFRHMTGRQKLAYHNVLEVSSGLEFAASHPSGPDACEPRGSDTATLRQQAINGPQARASAVDRMIGPGEKSGPGEISPLAEAMVHSMQLQHGAARLSQATTDGVLGSAGTAEHVGKLQDLEIRTETTTQGGNRKETAAKGEVTARPDRWGVSIGAVLVQTASD